MHLALSFQAFQADLVNLVDLLLVVATASFDAFKPFMLDQNDFDSLYKVNDVYRIEYSRCMY